MAVIGIEQSRFLAGLVYLINKPSAPCSHIQIAGLIEEQGPDVFVFGVAKLRRLVRSGDLVDFSIRRAADVKGFRSIQSEREDVQLLRLEVNAAVSLGIDFEDLTF